MKTIRPRRAAAALLFFYLLPGIAAGAAENGSRGFITYLDEEVPRLMERYAIPGTVIALVKEGKTIWKGAYGYADREKKTPMTIEAPCRVESISKSVTAWGVMKLVQEGVIELDRPVSDYITSWEIPESPFEGAGVTVRRLLSGNAGMPLGTIGVHYPPRTPMPALQEILTRDAVLMKKPGSGFYYSNTGFNILELLIQEVTGRPFAQYMTDEIMEPLGMKTASFLWQAGWDPPVPTGYSPEGEPVPVYVYPHKAAGGLFATIDDIAAFVTAGMPLYRRHGRQLLKESGIAEIYKDQTPLSGYYQLVFDGYGFGHFTEELAGGLRAVSHGGQGSGWMSHFHSIPETGDALIILSNSQRTWPFFSIILEEWSRRLGVGPVGMGLIHQSGIAIRIAAALLTLLLLLLLYRIIRSWKRGERRLSPLGREACLRRGGLFLLGTALITAVLWAATRDYFFLTSVYPLASGYLGGGLTAAGLLSCFAALFTPPPRRR